MTPQAISAAIFARSSALSGSAARKRAIASSRVVAKVRVAGIHGVLPVAMTEMPVATVQRPSGIRRISTQPPPLSKMIAFALRVSIISFSLQVATRSTGFYRAEHKRERAGRKARSCLVRSRGNLREDARSGIGVRRADVHGGHVLAEETDEIARLRFAHLREGGIHLFLSHGFDLCECLLTG